MNASIVSRTEESKAAAVRETRVSSVVSRLEVQVRRNRILHHRSGLNARGWIPGPIAARGTVIGAFALAALLSGCQQQESVDTQLYITQLETQVSQLDADLSAAYQEVSRLSGLLTTQVTALEASLEGLNLRVLDLPGATEPAAAIREVEAAVSVMQQRVEEVKGTTNSLAQYLE